MFSSMEILFRQQRFNALLRIKDNSILNAFGFDDPAVPVSG
jgi:hypothetical protein